VALQQHITRPKPYLMHYLIAGVVVDDANKAFETSIQNGALPATPPFTLQVSAVGFKAWADYHYIWPIICCRHATSHNWMHHIIMGTFLFPKARSSELNAHSRADSSILYSPVTCPRGLTPPILATLLDSSCPGLMSFFSLLDTLASRSFRP